MLKIPEALHLRFMYLIVLCLSHTMVCMLEPCYIWKHTS